tara:strand:+ start:1376 stop:1576 length:201 start_codon:yes stop_codon:yes gene_type:complete
MLIALIGKESKEFDRQGGEPCLYIIDIKGDKLRDTKPFVAVLNVQQARGLSMKRITLFSVRLTIYA